MVTIADYEYQKVFRYDNSSTGHHRPIISDVIIGHSDGRPWEPFLDKIRTHSSTGRQFRDVYLVPVDGIGCPFPARAVKEKGLDDWVIKHLSFKEE